MNGEGCPARRPANHDQVARLTTPLAGARQTTGLQAGVALLRGALEGAHEAMPPREYAVLVDLMARVLERERERTERWAA